MKRNYIAALTVSLLAAAILPTSVAAQSAAPEEKATVQMADMAIGEVKKIDKDAGKITLKHGDLKHLDMPGMTMVFTVKDKSLLDKVQPGDKVKFHAISENGKLMVIDLNLLK